MPPISTLKRRVIKLGGSLLDLPQIADRLKSVLESWPVCTNFVVVGGGRAADLIREWDGQCQLGNQRSHRMAIFAMTWNAKQMFGNHACFKLVRTVKCLPALKQTGVILAEPFLHSLTELPEHMPLAESWDVTSDSIAAVVAAALGADQLVMLKSVDSAAVAEEAQQHEVVGHENLERTAVVTANDSLEDISGLSTLNRLAEAGQVDAEFPRYASKIPSIGWCNFRRLAETADR
ncbi:MAG: hypothetical protein ABJZ55_12355 [Fuerstiella sp.]